MGYKISFVLGTLLAVVCVGSWMYIKSLNEQIGVLKGNQVVLESKITEQNESIDNYLEKQTEVAEKMNDLANQYNDALREAKELSSKFARHDLNDLALNKPKLIENRVNKGTKRVMNELSEITDPNQFDEDEETTDTES
tara:strand:- start:558 stop:974 length:417 start_codon:yes stop_codon:yes gene_type:complete